MFDDNVDEAELIEMANTIKDFEATCALTISNNLESRILCKTSLELSAGQRTALFGILQSNMRHIYESTSWGWDEYQKRKEMFVPSSRFIMLVNPVDESDIMAFAMFRFEWDDEEEPEHPVLFCYELQVQSAHQKKGLGKELMQTLLKIAAHCRMWKTMLTCFKTNDGAMAFYRRIGFGVDANSPSCFGHVGEPYEILSDKPRK